MTRLIIILFCICFLISKVNAQCISLHCHCTPGNTIATFPYSENFENGPGGWFSDGLGIWLLGTPAKPVINRAGGGNNSWMMESYSGRRYEANESYILRSPCFNLSSLQNPRISFKIFWDSETDIDGASLHIIIGNSHALRYVGDLSSNASCNGTNWYNGYNYYPKDEPEEPEIRGFGWTGTSQPGTDQCPGTGKGSGRWITATHTLNHPDIIGKPQVSFAFWFKSNMNKCYNYNGVAIDDIRIEETPSNLSIEAECLGGRYHAFASDGPCIKNLTWNFGDPASGAANISTEPHPTHRFSGPGTYTVSLSGVTNTNEPMQATYNVNVIAVDTSINWPGMCSNTPNANITLTASGSSTGYTYSWNTNPPHTGPSLNNVGPGLYISTVSAPGACAISDTFDLRNELPAVDLGNDIKICPGQTVRLSAGKFPGYRWQDGSTDSIFIARAAGRYHVTVTNAGGCTASDTMNVIMDCKNVYFPTAFTPNGDGLNDAFGPWGNLPGLKEYSLSIFDRYGTKVFFSIDPYKKWNGLLKDGRYNTGSFVWYSEYTLNGKKEKRKGALLLIQ